MWEGKRNSLFPGLWGSFWSFVPCIVLFSYRSKTPLVVWLPYCKGEACRASWISTERTCYRCVCVHVCIFPYFFPPEKRRMLKLTLVIVQQGRTKGWSRGMHGEVSKAQPLTEAQRLCLHKHTELQGPRPQQAFLLLAMFPMALLHIWAKEHHLQHLTVTLSLGERQISFTGTMPCITSLPGYCRISF